MELGDGAKIALEPGGIVRVDAATVRMLRNAGDEEAVYVVVGGADGYVGRDGRLPEGETQRARQSAPPAGAGPRGAPSPASRRSPWLSPWPPRPSPPPRPAGPWTDARRPR